MVNKVILLGNVGRDPELRSTQNGQTIGTLSLATSRRWKDKSGERQEQTEWHNLVAFGKTAELIGQYVSKGSKLYVEGRIQARSWEDKQTGEKKSRTEVVVEQVTFLGDPQRDGGGAPSADDDDDIPF